MVLNLVQGITINEPSSAPARGKSSSASNTNSAPAGKLKNVKMEDDPPLAIVMKELNEQKIQISKKKSSYSRNQNAQQVPPNALQNKHKTQFKINSELYGQKSHLSENCYEVLFCKKYKRTNHRTYDHADFMFSINANQHHNGQGESSSRSRPTRPSVSFPSCIHCGYNDHHSNDCLYYPTCEICRSYDHDTHGHNRIISLRRGINPRNPQHVTKNCETCGSNVHTTSDHNDIEWFRKRETLQAKNDESFKARKNESLSALRSKTPTKRWVSRMEQYLTFTDHALWKVIVNGDSVSQVASASAGAEGPIPPKTTKQKLARKNELKEKSTLMLAILDEHLLKFHACKDAKSLWEAIKNRFRGNEKSKKMQKNILKPNYENFVTSSQEGLDKTYDRFQKLISQLEIHGEVISQEDTNLKLMRSLPSTWNNIRFNHEKTADLRLDTLSMGVAMLTIRVKRFIKKIGRKLDLNDKETVGFDRTKVECYNCHRRGHFAKECRASRNQGNRNRDASRMNAPVDTSTTNALVVKDGIGSSSSNLSNNTCSKDCLKLYEALQKQIVVHEKNEAFNKENIKILKYDVQVKDISIKDLKNQLEEALKEKDDLKKIEESLKNLTKLINSQISEGFHAVPPPYTGNYMPLRHDLSFAGLDKSIFQSAVRNTTISVPKTKTSISKMSKNIVENPKTIRPSAPIIEEWDTNSDNDSVFRPKTIRQNQTGLTKINFVKSGKNVKSVNKENTHRQVEYPRKSQSPRGNKRNWNGMMTRKLGNVLNNKGRVIGQREIRPVWNNAQRVNHQNKLTHPHPKRNFVPTAVATKSGQVPVNAAKQSSPIAWQHQLGNPHYALQDQGIFDSGCSRHMTGNKFYLADYQDIDGGFVAFGGSSKGDKITGKCKIRNGKLDFEDVYVVKELKFNLFSISQICDKKNSVLFTETECLVLSPDFKLLDESQVLLKIPRQNNMYSFDLKNFVPSGDLTCLFAKATIDESNLWHRRLGHINFKKMNKLMRGNLVRGLPSKIFENDHTCANTRESNTKPPVRPKL
ncbi:ribonuclease H-like domain-containing protein [Tanacetum coccineum]